MFEAIVPIFILLISVISYYRSCLALNKTSNTVMKILR